MGKMGKIKTTFDPEIYLYMLKKSILDIQVSAFSSYKGTDPKNVNLLVWLRSLKYKRKVELIRNEKNPVIIKKLKSELPAITPSGLFKTRKASELIKHSGFLQFDIDYKDNIHIKNYQDLKSQISKIKEVAYCGLSVSGNGYWGLVSIKHVKNHKEHFEALQQVFKKMGVIIDKSCKDICRLRGYSIDENAYFNHNADVFTLKINKKSILKKTIRIATNNIINDTKNIVEKKLNIIQNKQIDITGNYEDWFSLGCSIANEFGEMGREYFHILSNVSNSYDYLITEKQFNHCLKNKYSYNIGTFFHFCRLNSIENN